MKKSFLVTGCAGFIGSHMTDYLLKRGHKVIGIDNLTSGKKLIFLIIIKIKILNFLIST